MTVVLIVFFATRFQRARDYNYGIPRLSQNKMKRLQHHICAYILYISSFLFLPVRNIIVLEFLYELPICTAHQWLHWFHQFAIVWIWTFLTTSFMYFGILLALLYRSYNRCLSFYFMNHLFYVYISLTTRR